MNKIHCILKTLQNFQSINEMNQYFSIISIFVILFANNVLSGDNDSISVADNNTVVLHLDDNMNRILFDLFVEVFGNNPNNNIDNQIEVPVSTVAQIYRNYTQEQLDSLRLELKKLDNRFDIVRKRVDGLQEKFLIANLEYALNKNLSKFENSFIQIGEKLITLQKLVLKFTNADQPFNENSIKNMRTGRKSMFSTIFNRLSGLLLGVTNDQSVTPQNSEPLEPNRLNRIIALMKALQSVKNVSSNGLSPKMQTDLVKLQTMLYRLQQIQLLNRLADERVFKSSSNMNPYGYEAILNLVKMVGTASGQNQLRALMRLFTAPQVINRVRNTNNLSQERLKVLMKAVEEQEKQRRQQIENQRQTDILNELLKNQKRQQQQIDSLIKLIETQNRNSNNNNVNDNWNKQISNNNNNLFNAFTTTTQRSVH